MGRRSAARRPRGRWDAAWGRAPIRGAGWQLDLGRSPKPRCFALGQRCLRAFPVQLGWAGAGTVGAWLQPPGISRVRAHLGWGCRPLPGPLGCKSQLAASAAAAACPDTLRLGSVPGWQRAGWWPSCPQSCAHRRVAFEPLILSVLSPKQLLWDPSVAGQSQQHDRCWVGAASGTAPSATSLAPGGCTATSTPSEPPSAHTTAPCTCTRPRWLSPKCQECFVVRLEKGSFTYWIFFPPSFLFALFFAACVLWLWPGARQRVRASVCVCEQACDEPGVTGPGRAAKVLSWCEPEIPSPPLQPFLEAAAGSVPAGCAPGAAVPVPAGSWRWRHGPAAGLWARAGDARTRAFHGGGQDNSHSCPPTPCKGPCWWGHPPAVPGSRGGSGRGARARSASACPARAVAEVLFPGASSWEMAPAGLASSPRPQPQPCPHPGWGTGPGDTRPPGAAAAARAEARRHQVLLAEPSLLRNSCLI